MASDRTCSVVDCERPFKRTHAGIEYCCSHYMRAWRYGDPASRMPVGKPRINKGGYRVLTGRGGHPLAVHGCVLEHRLVLFDEIGAGQHDCHWCGTEVRWQSPTLIGRLVVDHLDEDKLNNTPANLAASCHPCNIRRNREQDQETGRFLNRAAH